MKVHDSARNVIIFGVHINSSFHAVNRKNNFLVLREAATFGINGSFDRNSLEKKFY